VLGFKTGLSWSKASDEKMTVEQLFSNANVLRTHFMSAGYKPDTIAINMPVNGGVLLFRGSDGQDHTTVLILQGTFSQGGNNHCSTSPTPKARTCTGSLPARSNAFVELSWVHRTHGLVFAI
jgi:hypothetical protein